MKKLKRMIGGAGCVILAIALIIGCTTTQQVVTETVVYMVAEEVGIFVAQNDPAIYDQAIPYYKTMVDLYNAGDKENFAILTDFGIKWVIGSSGIDQMTAQRITSKLIKLAQLTGLNSPEIPSLDQLKNLDMGVLKEAVDGFINGLTIVHDQPANS